MTSVRVLISEEQRSALERLREEAPVIEALFHDELRRQIAAALGSAAGLTAQGDVHPYVNEVYDDSVIYSLSGREGEQYFKAAYTLVDDQVTVQPGTAVKRVVSYEPVMAEAVDPNVGGGVDRSKIPAADFAGKNRSFPIVTPGDVADAARSIGRAGPDDYSSDELKRRIIAIARRKGDAFVAKLPKAWRDELGEAERDSISEFTPLIEKAVRGDGLVPIKIIKPGWGSSGYYSADVLQNSSTAFPAGTHMYWNHPTESERRERPERDLRDLAAVTVTPARWDESGEDGPGLYALSTVVPHYRDHVDSLAEHIGLSINAYGTRHKGQAEGRKGFIVDTISEGESIDFVTKPGAGGKIVGLFESARAYGRPLAPGTPEGDEMDDQERRDLTERAERAERELAEARTACEGERTRRERAEERAAIMEAKAVITTKLAESNLPDVTRQRLEKGLVAGVKLTEDGAFDHDAFVSLVETSVAEERAYIDGLSEAGKVRDQGAPSGAAGLEAAQLRLTESYMRQGMTEDQAKRAAGL